MQTFETRNDIKARILKDLAREWGYRNSSEIDLNAFDPMVDLLLGACSYELEKISNEITNSRNRIFERLIEILTPDIMANAQSAHSIMHGDPVEARQIIGPLDQFSYRSPELNRDINFSPVQHFSLLQAKICYLGYDNQVVKLNDDLQKERYFEAAYGRFLAPGEFYIGLRSSQELRSLHQLSFFFDWKNEARSEQFKKYLGLSKWFLGGRQIQMQTGCSLVAPPSGKNRDDLFYILSQEQYLEKRIINNSKTQFLTIDQPEMYLPPEKEIFPREWDAVFDPVNLQQMTEPLHWIRVEFPPALHEQLNGMDCLTNCFPVMNKRLHEKQESLHPEVHILPISFEDGYFLSTQSVENSGGQSYQEVPLKIIDSSDEGMFAIRHEGVNRFDSREANQLLNYVMDVLDDESAAFRALGYQTVGADIKEMDVIFNRMYKNINRTKTEMRNTSFLFVQPFANDLSIFVKFWTTDGELANDVPHGVPLKPVNSIHLVPTSLQMVTNTKGGRAPLLPVDRVQAFRCAVITRGKIVTAEDIKSFCAHQLGLRNIESIKVQKGVMQSKREKEGLIRCMDVHIYKKRLAPVNEDEWVVLCNDVETELANRASAMFPIRIISHEYTAG